MNTKSAFALVALALPATLYAAEPLPLERIYASPALDGKSTRALKWSPDSTRVTYLQGREDNFRQLDLWEYNIEDGKHRMLVDSTKLFSGKEELSDEEKARRERMRLRASGIVSYKWSEDGKALLFPAGGDLYYYDIHAKSSRKLTDTPEYETDIRFSPKGNYVSFIREQNLYVLEIASGKTTQLTKDGKDTIKYGMAEFVAQEEMGRMTGYWWAPDESRIAFTRTDESGVQEAVRNEIYAEEIKLYNQRYPYAGTPNATVELAVYNLNDGKTQWLDMGKEKDFYLTRAKWAEDSRTLSYQWQDRELQKLELRFYDSQKQTTKTVVTETSESWVNLHNSLYFLKDKKHFIWASERDGFNHLYLYRNDGKLVRQLTQGDWMVDELRGVDEKAGKVYFSGRADTPLEGHLYVTGLFKSASIKRITEGNGSHGATLSEDHRFFIDFSSSPKRPWSTALRHIDGKLLTWFEKNEVNKDHPLAPYIDGFVQGSIGQLKAEDGQSMYYKLYKPKNIKPGQKLPVIVYVYGGPGAQLVKNTWGGNYYIQYLVQQGFVVFQLDNRGSEGRGVAFESPIHRRLGEIEVQDQVAGVKYLRSLDFVDGERIGIYGHSYGGYMTLMAMFKAGDYFKAGVSGAPVTDWGLYDTYYTEKYLDHPKYNADGYEASGVFPYAKNLKGDLLIYHGMADDNVLFTNATKLFKVLQDEGLPFEMMTYPGAKHSMHGEKTKVHLYRTITNFFKRTLQ